MKNRKDENTDFFDGGQDEELSQTEVPFTVKVTKGFDHPMKLQLLTDGLKENYDRPELEILVGEEMDLLKIVGHIGIELLKGHHFEDGDEIDLKRITRRIKRGVFKLMNGRLRLILSDQNGELDAEKMDEMYRFQWDPAEPKSAPASGLKEGIDHILNDPKIQDAMFTLLGSGFKNFKAVITPLMIAIAVAQKELFHALVSKGVITEDDVRSQNHDGIRGSIVEIIRQVLEDKDGDSGPKTE